MRDPTVYTPDKTWTPEDSALADRLLLDYGKHKSAAIATHADEYWDRHQTESPEEVQRVWQQLQTFPHCFEIAERHLALDTLELDGSPSEVHQAARTLAQLQYMGWSIRVTEMTDFHNYQLLSPGLAEFFARALRCHLTSNECLLRQDLLRSRKMAVKMRLSPHSPPRSLPACTLIPYRTTKSQRWSLFVLRRTAESQA